MAFVDKSAIVPKDVPGLKADPPAIFFSRTPAVLVNFDGDPIWGPIQKNDLKFAVNTNWDVFEHEPTKTYYLRDNQTWLTTKHVEGADEAAIREPSTRWRRPCRRVGDAAGPAADAAERGDTAVSTLEKRRHVDAGRRDGDARAPTSRRRRAKTPRARTRASSPRPSWCAGPS